MSHLLLVLGGARSGKSAYAEQRVHDMGATDVLYVATLLPGEPGVDARIAAHRERRPAWWRTIEAGAAVVDALRDAGSQQVVLLDGFELALAATAPAHDGAACALAADVAVAMRDASAQLAVVVASEVGLGVVPSTEAGVSFRDRLGTANQVLAADANEVVLVVAGLPLHLKGGVP